MLQFGVMGNPVEHSLSPFIHQQFASQFNLVLSYRKILVEIDNLAAAITHFQAANGLGLNLTAPFKQQAFNLVNEVSERAAKAGSINTIKFTSVEKRLGDNTDGVGLIRDLVGYHNVQLADRRVLMLGAGGAVQGILDPIFHERPARLVIHNRTFHKAKELAKTYQIEALTEQELTGQQFDIIINGTSISLKNEELRLPAGIIKPGGACYDLAYRVQDSAFFRWATLQGADYYDGIGMLIEQAAESFYLFHGLFPETLVVRQQLQKRQNNNLNIS